MSAPFLKWSAGLVFLVGFFVGEVYGEEKSGGGSTPASVQPESPVERVLGFSGWIEDRFDEAGEAGVRPFFNYWATWQGNPFGGLGQGTAYAQETLFGVTLDADKLVGLRGTSFVVSGSANAGTNLSETIGNVFNVSQAYVVPTILLYEVYWAQKLFDDRFEFRLGRMSASDWFASLPAFGMQVQGGIDGNPTSIFLNSSFTSSPNAVWAVAAKVKPVEDFYGAAGVYQASDRIGKIAYHGVDFSIRPQDGMLILGEVGWEPTLGKMALPPAGSKEVVSEEGNGYAGIYKVGGYLSTLPAADARGGEEKVTFGFYALAQQEVWRSTNNPDINFSLWAGVTYSPQYYVAQMPWMGMAGTIWQGMIPGRPQDQFLCTWLIGSFGPSFSPAPQQAGGRPSAETVFDVSYIINLTEQIFVQPDIQYVIRPNGTSTPGALVLGLQFGCNF
jgi:porin